MEGTFANIVSKATIQKKQEYVRLDLEALIVKIIRLRALKYMTQSELAKKIGVSKTTMCNYEKGRSAPTLDAIINIAYVFEMDISTLLNGCVIETVIEGGKVIERRL